MRWLALVLLWVAVAAPAVGAGPASPARSSADCRRVALPAPRDGEVPRPALRLDRGQRATVVLRTNCGSIRIALDTRRAPKTTSSVAGLVRRGYYDRLTFHRVARGFVIQGGDPRGNGMGGPGYRVVERPPRDLVYTRGVVAMAKTMREPDGTSGSQFFIVTARDAQLPPMYALLGRVVAGMDTVDRIEALSPGGRADGPPRRPVVIRRATLDLGPR